MTTKKCEVCQEEEFKYKCPQCLLKYCSVNCYKSHKKICQKSKPDINDKESTSLPLAEKTVGSIDFLNLEEEETADRVPLEKLQMLALESVLYQESDIPMTKILHQFIISKAENSSNMKVILENPHLRAMMENLCNSEHIEQDMAKAMMEPIFTEFADECLKIVENDR